MSAPGVKFSSSPAATNSGKSWIPPTGDALTSSDLRGRGSPETRLFFELRLDVTAHRPRHLRMVELVLPFRYDDGRHAVADEVRQRARLGHEAIDAEDQRQATHGNRRNARKRRREHDEAAAGHARRTLRREQEHTQYRELLHQR